MPVKIKKGKVYYKVWVNKSEIGIDYMKDFLKAKGVLSFEINKLDNMGDNTKPVEIFEKDFSLTIDRSHETDLILLLGCNLNTDEFNKFMEGWFE